MLARGVRAPHVGGVLVVPVSPPAPRGVLGIVTTLGEEHDGSTRVSTRPATLQDAYSTFDLKVDDTLGDLLGEAAKASAASLGPHAHSAGLTPSFHCNGSTAPITADVDLSQLHLLLDVNASVYSPSIQFILEGSPTFTLNYGVSAAVNCTASLNGPPIPLGDTGLFLTMGPEFSFSAGGALSAHMTWSPFIGITFFRSLRSGNSDSHTFRNGGSTSFTGSASANLSLGLQTTVSLGEGDAELAAISGTIGPVITAGVQATQAQTCFNVNASAEANLSASAHVLFKNWEYDIGDATFGNLQLYHGCTGSGSSGGGGGGGSPPGSGSAPPGGGSTPPGGGGGPGGSPGENESAPENKPPVGTAASPLQWSPPRSVPFDRESPSNNFGNWIASVSCGSPSLCVGVDDAGNAVVSTTPLQGNWHVEQVDPQLEAYNRPCPVASYCASEVPGSGVPVQFSYGGLRAVSCPSSRLCVAVDDYGNIVWSIDPAGGTTTWHVERVDESNEITSISCPSESLCLIADHSGRLLVSTDPTGGPSKWSVSYIARSGSGVSDHIERLSCPSVARCFAVDEQWNNAGSTSIVFTTEDPSGAPAPWTEVLALESDDPILGLSCPTLNLCVAVDGEGHVATATEPTSWKSWTWQWVTEVPDEDAYWPPGGGLSCTTTAFCAFGGTDWDIWTTSDPAGSWFHDESVDDFTNVISGVTCLTATECVAVDANGGVLMSETPSVSWRSEWADPQLTLNALDCATDGFCVALNQQGDAVSSADATTEDASWQPAQIGDNAFPEAVSCAGPTLCAGINEGGGIATSADTGAGDWNVAMVDDVRELTGIACPTVELCVAVDASGSVLTSTNPTGGAAAWAKAAVDATGLTGVSCPSASLCVAVDQEGRVLISSNPAAGASSWSSPVPVSSSGGILAVSCPTVALCVLVTGVGNVITSEDPTGGPAAWSEPASVAGGVALTAVSCSSQGLCAALDHRGEVVASVNPTGGTSAWSLAGGSGSGRWLGCNIVCFRYCVSGRRPWWWCNNRYCEIALGCRSTRALNVAQSGEASHRPGPA